MSTTTTDFVPAELDATRWENLQPLYQALQDRDPQSADELEQLVLDRSELDSAASEAGRPETIKTSRIPRARGVALLCAVDIDLLGPRGGGKKSLAARPDYCQLSDSQ